MSAAINFIKKRGGVRGPECGLTVKAVTWSVAHRQWVVAREEQYLFKRVNIAHQLSSLHAQKCQIVVSEC